MSSLEQNLSSDHKPSNWSIEYKIFCRLQPETDCSPLLHCVFKSGDVCGNQQRSDCYYPLLVKTVCQFLGLSCDVYPPLIGSLLGFETSVPVHINVFQFLISHKKRPKHKDLFYRWQRKVSRSFLLSWIFGVSRCKVFTATQCSLVKPWDNMIGDIFFILHGCRYSL